MTSIRRPEVLRYTDHRVFLEDWFRWKKEQNPRFSHRLFARLAGQRSPSLLLSVIKGQRNLTDKTAEAFARAMGLSDSERAAFCMLVQLERSEAGVERRVLVAAIPASRVDALLKSFQEQLQQLREEVSDEAERVYQIGLHLAPISVS